MSLFYALNQVLNTAQSLITPVFNGKKIRWFTKGDVLRVSRLNELVSCVNPFLSLEIQRGSSDSVAITPEKVVVTLKDSEGGGGGSSAPSSTSNFRLKAMYNDYVVGHLLTLVGGVLTEDTSTSYYIAKPGKLRISLTSETKYTLPHTYTYPGGDPDPFNAYRLDSWPGGSELQLVTPPWGQDDEIQAESCNTVVLGLDGNPCQWIMVTPHRQWAKSNP